MFSTNTNTTLAAINTNLTLAATTNTTLAATTNTTMVNMSLAYFPPVQFTTIIIIIISRTLTEVDLPVASSPHRVAVVDADVLPLLDVHRRPDHHPARDVLNIMSFCHLKSPSKCLLALLMQECSRREMFAYNACNTHKYKYNLH